MAGLYDHYKNVDPKSITSATSSLRSKIEASQRKLQTLKTSLESDDVWKAEAKATLLKALNTIDTEVYKEILDKLNTADEVASTISNYNSAKSTAEGYIGKLQNSKSDNPNRGSWQQGQANAEQEMRDCISKINTLV